MNIWILEIGEPLPLEKDARLLRYGLLSRYLAEMGHDVTWWASSFSHVPKVNIVNSDCDVRVNGVNLKLLHGRGYSKNISLQRIRHQKKFAKKFYSEAFKLQDPDILMCTIPTIDVAAMAVKYGLQKKIPVLVDIRDQWPDEIVDLVPTPLRFVARIFLGSLFLKMKYVCKNATGIIGISQNYFDYGKSFAERCRNKNDLILPLGYPNRKLDQKKVEQAKEWWLNNGLSRDSFKCCFFGTVGNFFNFDSLMEASNILKEEIDLQIVFCGTGSKLEKYQKLSKYYDAILFPGWVDSYKIEALMEMSDIGLAPYSLGTRMSLPNKPFEYFSGGLPVLSSIKGELSQLLERYNCGYSYRSDSVEEICYFIKELYENPQQKIEMGRNARNLFESHFCIDTLAVQLERHLLEVVQNR